MLTAWNIWAREDQTPPEGDWHSWLFLGGRGAGKTRAGAEWVKGLIGQGLMSKGLRVALIGPTLHDVREVMIDGPSGLRSVSEPGNRPFYEVSRRRLRWPDGGVAYAFSAEEPERLRGPQFHYAWADEFCAWRAPAETLAQLRMGLRLGETPRLCVTTTPKPIAALKALMKEEGAAVTRAATKDNLAGLSEVFLDGLTALYGGTRLAAQELDGLVVEDAGAALWRADDLARCYGARPPAFDEVIVAVDPPASSHGDACGIVAAGRVGERGYVLCDATVSGLSPLGWARQAAAVAREHGARQVVAEGNQGGEMVRTLLAQAGCEAPIRLVHARDGKRRRAEPVAALYEQGRVTHCPGDGGRFNALDEELMALGAGEMAHNPAKSPAKSPDRADALVWALTMLLLDGRAEPRLRRL
ncbi:MAG: DNA-packaging protein [Asticcacaulis sp.]|uniref:DNA-packaging protein n=1 Tax=Asticcacaulis sp. TaxID=1872648 RepID=UPI003F7B80D6